jgi:hypothetical protein
MKRIYISGKITGVVFEDALEQFALAEKKLCDMGYEVTNPMTIAHEHDKSWENYMRLDLKAMLECDSIYMLINWEASKGAVIEHNLAKDLGFKIHYQNTKKRTQTK